MPEFSFGGIINFLIGVVFGLVIFALTYVYVVFRSNWTVSRKSSAPIEEVDEEKLKALITDKQKTFKRLYKRTGKSFGKIIFDLSYELVQDISEYYYPKSKHPMLELSVEEMLELNRYITQRIDGLLERNVLRGTRNVRVSGIVYLYEKKKAVEETKIVRIMRSKSATRLTKITLGALNAMNPAYWVRKLVVRTSIDFMTRHIAFVILGVVAEETSKVYSKKLFNKEPELNIVEDELRLMEEGVDDEDD